MRTIFPVIYLVSDQLCASLITEKEQKYWFDAKSCEYLGHGSTPGVQCIVHTTNCIAVMSQ